MIKKEEESSAETNKKEATSYIKWMDWWLVVLPEEEDSISKEVSRKKEKINHTLDNYKQEKKDYVTNWTEHQNNYNKNKNN